MNAVAAERWPLVLPGFEHIKRNWDVTHEICSARILPGEFYVTTNHELITTVLGSCVSACILDPETGFGGMNHFMLPGENNSNPGQWAGQDSLETRFGVAAMEALISSLVKLGAPKERLEVKLFGGGEVLAMDTHDVGNVNIKFVKKYVSELNLKVTAEDLGGVHPRKVLFFPKTGKVMVRKIRSIQTKMLVEQEKQYQSSIGG